MYLPAGTVGYQGISTGWYFVILAARLLSLAVLAATVVGGHPAAGTGSGPRASGLID